VRSLTTTDVQGHVVMGTTVVPLEVDKNPVRSAENDADALRVLRSADADFAPAALCDHARNAFTALRRAWAGADADLVRPYVGEQELASLRQSMDDLHARGLHRLADDPLVDDVRITRAADADGYLSVVCEVAADLVDADADASGTLVRGSTALQHVECLLTFRRHDLAHSPGSDITVLRCPRCGAPLRAAVLEPCPYCRQAVADGGGSWELVDIGPLQPARAVAHEAVAHPAQPCPALVAADPGLNVFDVLATARESFYAIEASTAHLDATTVSDRLTPAALAMHADRIGRLRAAGHRLRLTFLDLTGAAIAGGDVLADGSMRITVRFGVSGDASEVDSRGNVVAGAGAVTRWAEDWDLVRHSQGAPWLVDTMRPVPG
jgi:predicted lipid-binding transport protein (Tim44 family)